MKQLSIILLTLSLAACGGSGSPTTAASDAKASSSTTPAADTPMSTLVVPETMKWVTSSEPSLNISVRDDKSAAAAGASVSLFTFTMNGPQAGEVLDEPVAMAAIDTAVADSNGQVRFPARLPAHLTQVLVVSSMGALSGKQVVDLASLDAGINLTLK